MQDNQIYINFGDPKVKLLRNSDANSFEMENGRVKITNIFGMTPELVYILVRLDYLNSFPLGYFTKNREVTKEGKERARKIIKFFIDYLDLTDEEIYNNLSRATFYDNGLRNIVKTVYNSSCIKAIMDAYPNRFKLWLFNKMPVCKNYWNKQTAVEAIRWTVKKKLKLNRNNVCKKVCFKFFEENKLRSALNIVFNGSTYKAISTSFPEENYLPWEFKSVGNDFWNEKTAVEAIKWMVEEKLNWNENQVKLYLNYKVFTRFNLRGMLFNVFGDSCYNAINNAYPGIYLPWEFKCVPNCFWQKEENIVFILNYIKENDIPITREGLDSCNLTKIYKHVFGSIDNLKSALATI